MQTRALATQVLFEGTRAVGVEYQYAMRTRRALGREVILCGGAINSPQLLQLSGVGTAADLERLGVSVTADLPGVGQNLQDHLEVYIQYGPTLVLWPAPGACVNLWQEELVGDFTFECGGKPIPRGTIRLFGMLTEKSCDRLILSETAT